MRKRAEGIRFWRGAGIVLLCIAIILTGSIGPWIGNVQAASSWNVHNSNTTTDITNIAYGNGRWVGVGNGGQIITSTNGVSWSNGSLAISPLGVLYAGNRWIMVGNAGKMYTSTDGVTWSLKSPPASVNLNAIAHGGSRYVVVGNNGTILTSTDTNTWAAQTNGADHLYGVAYGGGKFVAVGDKGVIYTSSDGLSWLPAASGASDGLYSATYANGIFIAVGLYGVVLTSPDGTAWTRQALPAAISVLYGVGYGSNKFVAVGADGAIFSSPTGASWVKETSGTTEYLNHVAFGDGRLIVVGERGALVSQLVSLSSDANLSGLALSASALSPAFASGTTSYTSSVGHSVAELNVTPTVVDIKSTVKVNGIAVASGTAARVPLNVGSNTITVLVTAEDGTTTKTYTVTVTRAVPPSSNANLSGLTLSAGALSPAFASGTTSYTSSVAHHVTELDVTPTVADSKASVAVNGTATSSGSAARVPLNVGSNTVTVVVTAEDGTTTKTYTVTVTRATSSNADLSSLTLSAGTLTPAFASGTTSYTASVANGVAELDVTAMAADSNASVKVNGASVASGSATRVTLAVGANPITVEVTAQDGTTKKTYTMTITRATSSNADLSGLALSVGTLTPAFASGTTSYTASVANGVAELNVTATAADSNASVKVNGASVASGSATRVTLAVGANPITVEVTAQDGTAKTYTVTVTRATSSNADLSSLTLSAGTLTPAFASGTTSYTASVASNITELDVTPTVSDSKASVVVNGTATASGSAARVPLNVGSNVLTLIVTAEDGTTKAYIVTVTRSTPPKSGDAELSSLALSTGTLSPVFSSSTTSYSVSVTNAVYDVNVSATTSDVAAAITINGTAAANGSAVKVPLNLGANVISILVTAQDGTTKTYTVTVTRLAPPQSSNTDLSSLTLSSGTLSPVFSSGITGYTASVTNAVYEVNVSAIAADATATLTINGAVAANGSAVKVALTVGSNTIAILVTAQDGSSKLYTVTLTREAPASNGGSGGSGGYTPEESKGRIQVIDANGTILNVLATHLVDAKLQLSADIYESNSSKRLQQGIKIAVDGTFTFKQLPTGTYRMYVYVTSSNGERLAGIEGELIVSSSGIAVMKAKALDPFGIVRDADTQRLISGAKVSLYWADTEQNRNKGRTPGALVELPRVEAKKLSYNENVQYSDTEGRFGWLFFPEGDYYVIAEKEGFKTFDSRKASPEQIINVKKTAVQLDIRMSNETKEQEHAPYIFGYKDGTFRPNNGITRAELASILARLFIQKDYSEDRKGRVAYSDVDASHWAAKQIVAVAQSELMIGDKNGQFQPDRIVTRAEIAIIVSKLKQLKTGNAYKAGFTDVKGHWAESYIEAAFQAELLKGFPDGTYRPQQSLTRAEVVVLLNKILGRHFTSVEISPKWKDVKLTYWAYDDIMEASMAHRYLLKDGQEIWLIQ